MPDHVSSDQRAKLIVDRADACVACGLCLNVCPTYQLYRTEVESPRGRIALAKGIAARSLRDTKKNLAHLDTCLLCGSCEKVCPAKVAYTDLINETRALVFRRGKTPVIDRFFNHLVVRRKNLAFVRKLLWLYQRLKLNSALGFLSISRLPQVEWNPGRQRLYPARKPVRGKVYLFVGCVAGLFDNDTLDAGAAVLNRFGYDVEVPPEQVCCGAVAEHCGDTGRADLCGRSNAAVFTDPDMPIIVSATGCVAALRRHFGSRVFEISAFLAQQLDNDPVLSTEIRKSVRTPVPRRKLGVYLPCTLRNTLQTGQSVFSLLEAFGANDFVDLSIETNCCGAAGTYMYRHGREAGELKARLYRKIEEERIECVLTLNIGCRLHLMNYSGNRRFVVLHLLKYLADEMTAG